MQAKKYSCGCWCSLTQLFVQRAEVLLDQYITLQYPWNVKWVLRHRLRGSHLKAWNWLPDTNRQNNLCKLPESPSATQLKALQIAFQKKKKKKIIGCKPYAKHLMVLFFWLFVFDFCLRQDSSQATRCYSIKIDNFLAFIWVNFSKYHWAHVWIFTKPRRLKDKFECSLPLMIHESHEEDKDVMENFQSIRSSAMKNVCTRSKLHEGVVSPN